MLRFITTVLVTAMLIFVVHPASAQDETVDFTARGGVKDLIGRVDALEAQPDADTLGGLNCTNDQIAKFNGVAWVCDVDQDTDTSAADCPSGQVLVGDGNSGTCQPFPPVFDDGKVFLRMSLGEEVTIAQNGPLRLIARCDTSSSGPRITIFATSSQDGWFVGSSAVPYPAGALQMLGKLTGPNVPTPSWYSVIEPWGHKPVVSPSGHYLGHDLAYGVNIFGLDCLVAGQVVAVTEP